jgi:hypothetical protein
MLLVALGTPVGCGGGGTSASTPPGPPSASGSGQNRHEQSGKELEMNRHLRQDQESLAHRFVVMATVDRNFSAKHGDPDHG